MKQHLIMNITGRVQGVFFRDATARQAQKLGVSGFVKNMPDGSVYIEAEGEEEALQAFLTWARRGPAFARVVNVHYEFRDVLQGFGGFTVQ